MRLLLLFGKYRWFIVKINFQKGLISTKKTKIGLVLIFIQSFTIQKNYIKVIFTMKVLVEKPPPLDVYNSCGYSAIQIRIEAGIDAPSNIDSKNISISFLNKN